MSIYNMIASIVGGGGGEVETGTCTLVSSYTETATFQNTHTRVPDIALCYPNDEGGGTSDRTAWIIYITSEGAFADEWSALYGDNFFWADIKNDSSSTVRLMRTANTNIADCLTTEGITFRTVNTDAWSFQINKTYVWWAIWLDGSGSGGGGGGSSMNVQTNQTTSRTSATTLTSVNSLTCTTAGTYDVYWTCDRSSTSGTWSSQLYVNGTASGSEQTTWSNHVQTVHLTGVTIGANQTVAVYVKARGTNYYGYCPQLTIVQTS